MSLMMTLLQKGIKLESSIAGLPPAQRAAARQQARLAERAGAADRDEPGHAERADNNVSLILFLPDSRVDRLVLASLLRMSASGRQDFIRRWKDDPGGYARWAVEAARVIEARG